MTRNRKHDDDDASASNRKRLMTCASRTDINHDVVNIVMMKLGFGDYYSFRGVCKSWRSFACENEKMVMTSMPPMSISVSSDPHEKACYLKDFEGRKFKIILPDFAVGDFIGVACGYLIFFSERTHNFWLVNPITRKQLHFPDFQFGYRKAGMQSSKFILVFSPSLSGWVFVVLRGYYKDIWFCIAGKRAWNHASYTFPVTDLYAFKGKLYTLTYNPSVHGRQHLFELRLSPEPKFTLLKTKNTLHSKYFNYPYVFVSSSENLYVMGWTPDTWHNLLELDIGNMEWVVPCANTMLQYAFFHSGLNRVVAVKQQSGIDPRTRSLGIYASSPDTDNNASIRFFNAGMWYFPHECMKVDRIDE